MDIDSIKELAKAVTESLNLKDYQGDIVALKVVENEFGNIEPGGIGVQKVYRGNDEHCSDEEQQDEHDECLNPSKIDKAEGLDTPPTDEDSEVGVDNAKPAEEERFRFIHVEIEDEEAWRIHRAIKRLVVNYSIPDICEYLKELKKNGKVMLPSNSTLMYNELVRLGMPTGEGYTEKHFKNNYTK